MKMTASRVPCVSRLEVVEPAGDDRDVEAAPDGLDAEPVDRQRHELRQRKRYSRLAVGGIGHRSTLRCWAESTPLVARLSQIAAAALRPDCGRGRRTLRSAHRVDRCPGSGDERSRAPRPAPLPGFAVHRRGGDPDPDRGGRLAGVPRYGQPVRPRPRGALPVPAVHPAHPAGRARRRPIRPSPRPAPDLPAGGGLLGGAARTLAGRGGGHGADLRRDGPVRGGARLQPADEPGAAAQPGADRVLSEGGGDQLVSRAGGHDRRSRAGRSPGPLRRPGGLCARTRAAGDRRGAGCRSARRRPCRGLVASRSRGRACCQGSRSCGRDRSCSARSRSTCSPSCSAARPRCCRSTPARSSTSARRASAPCAPPRRSARRSLAAVVAVRPIRRRRPLDVRRRRGVRGRDDRVRHLDQLRAQPGGARGHGRRRHGERLHPASARAARDARRHPRPGQRRQRGLHRRVERARRVRVRASRRPGGAWSRRSSSGASPRWWWAASGRASSRSSGSSTASPMRDHSAEVPRRSIGARIGG